MNTENSHTLTPTSSPAFSWLLEEKDPSVRYRIITELIGRYITSDEKTIFKNTVYESKAVQTIFTKIVPDTSKSTGAENIGEGFCFTHLAELAVDSEYPPMDRLAERII